MKTIKKRNRNRSYHYKDGSRTGKWKIYISAFIVFLSFTTIAYKAFTLQVADRNKSLKIAEKQHFGSFGLLPRRGNILDRNNRYLATNVDTDSIYINPKQIRDPKKFAKEISANTHFEYRKVLALVSSNKSFVWLKRLADEKLVKKLKGLNIEGIGFLKEPKRVYPNEYLLGQVLGFTDIDSKGIEGIEYGMDKVLSGTPQKIRFRKDAKGRQILRTPADLESPARGHEVQLTIDSTIQHIVEKELKTGIIKTEAESGMAVAMNPNTGEILAMASYPFFNPNRFAEFPEQYRRNFSIWQMFEPGSTLKVFLVAAALEEGVVESSSTYDCENGKRKIGSKVIKDAYPHEILTVSETIQVSSNICASKIGENVGKANLYSYLRDFGFGKVLGVDLPGESPGMLSNSRKWGPLELATISFGQGVSITSLQLATAMSAIANGGYLMKPHIVKQINSPDGITVKQKSPEALKKVISYETAMQATSILQGVVENGSGKNAKINGYKVAGKTGTAQIPDLETGGYHKDRYIASFVGFAPAYEPEITLAVVVHNPKKSIYGGSVAAPIFRSITEKTLFHLGVPADSDFSGEKLMPDLAGKSKRDILKWASQTGVEVKFDGAGFAVSQSPETGQKIKSDTICSFTLSQDI